MLTDKNISLLEIFLPMGYNYIALFSFGYIE